MKHFWWKILGVLILIYVIVYSFLIPLAPGISPKTKLDLQKGLNKVELVGYNTNFTQAKDIHGEIVFRNQLVEGNKLFTIACFNNIAVVNDSKISFDVLIPDTIPSRELGVRLYTDSYKVPTVVTQVADTSTYSCTGYVKVNDSITEKQFICGAVKEASCSSALAGKNDFADTKTFPYLDVLYETIRNLMFHVPMWFTMIFLMLISFIYSIKYLMGFKIKNDYVAKLSIDLALLFAALGLITGAIWAKFTWNEGGGQDFDLFSLSGWWANDVKLNGSAISTLIYIAYRILRNSIEDEQQKAKVGAVYNIFAFILMLVFIMVLPRMYESLHPGNGGNPAFGGYDLNNTLRMVFYPAVIGWILLGAWMLQLKLRYHKLKLKTDDEY